MTRIVAGLAGGRRLAVPARGTRPTSDRAREGLFNSLIAHFGDLDGLRFADLYAGSGAVGLEALSRGAVAVLLVESAAGAARTVRANVATVALAGAAVVAQPVERVVAVAPEAAYDVVFCDPPYDLPGDVLRRVLTTALAHRWLAADGLVVVERASREDWTWPAELASLRVRRYGDATLWYGRAAPDSPAPEVPCAAPSAPDRSIPSPTATSTSSPE